MMLSGDVRYAFRMMRRNPGFTAVIVTALALGIGASTAVFTIFNSVLLKTLPLPEIDRLVEIGERNAARGVTGSPVAPGNYFDWKSRNHSFEALAAYKGARLNLVTDGSVEEILGQLFSHEAFRVIGIQPLLGRSFTREEDYPDAPLTAILSYGLWQRRFGGKQDIIGKTITLGDQLATVIGVMPPNFRFTDAKVQLWLPFQLKPTEPMPRFLNVIGRLRRNVTVEAGSRDIQSLAADLVREHPVYNTGWTTEVIPFHEFVVGNARLPVLLLFCAVGSVLLIACANVANLLLARATVRTQETFR